MTATTPLRWADEADPVARRMIFAAAVAAPYGERQRRGLVAAWQLYQSGCLARLRDRLAGHLRHIGRVRLITAEHGVLHPYTRVPPSSRQMTPFRAEQLRPQARRALMDEVARYGVPRDVLMLALHPYPQVIADIYQIPGLRPHLQAPGHHEAAWPLVAAVLDGWGWP